jgi:hypothetical protein
VYLAAVFTKIDSAGEFCEVISRPGGAEFLRDSGAKEFASNIKIAEVPTYG